MTLLVVLIWLIKGRVALIEGKFYNTLADGGEVVEKS
jgi:hypothetical protein